MFDIGINHHEVILTFSGKCLLNIFGVGGQVLEHHSPAFTPKLYGNAIPGKLFQFINIYNVFIKYLLIGLDSFN